MNTRAMVLLLAGVLLVGAGCNDGQVFVPTGSDNMESSVSLRAPSDPHGEFLRGPAVPLGRGTAQSWVEVDPGGTPLAIGLDLSEGALERLGDDVEQLVLDFHPRANVMPYTHILLDYNPTGHEPPGVYDLEHFDVHFYMIPEGQRLAIGPDDDDEFANAPPAQYLPADYLMVPGGVPQMGAHWVDLQAPEFNGGIFTRTLIWGSYDGHVIFVEPMITVDYLRGYPSETVPIRQPNAFERDGYYPTEYSVERLEQPGAYRVSLGGLTFHAGE